MPSANDSGVIAFGPAIARGAAPQTTLIALNKLVRHGGDGPVVKEWRDSATVAILGQLAATGVATNEKILAATCTVAKAQRSLAGLEPVFLSALLGAPRDSEMHTTAQSVWSTLGRPAGTGDDLVPVLDATSRELRFLTRADISSLTGFELRSQLATLCGERPASPGDAEDQIAFATHLLVAASAVASAQMIKAQPDSSRYIAAAVKLITPAQRSEGLPQVLLAGSALLVGVCLIEGVSPPAVAGPWKSVWPSTPVVSAGAVPDSYWKTAKLCPAWPAAAKALATLVVIRDNTVVLPALPRFDAEGRVAERSFYPPLGDGEEADPFAPERAWRLRQSRTVTATLPDPLIDLSGFHTDPQTGQLVDALGHPVGRPPSVAFGRYGGVADVRGRLVAAARDAGLPATAQITDILQLLAETDYGQQLNLLP
jgi:hypothetical protein